MVLTVVVRTCAETPKIQSPSERDRSDESKLPSNAREVEAMRLDSAARNPLTAFSFEELRKVTNGFRQDSLIGGGGFGRVYKGAVGTDGGEDEPLQVAVKVHDGDNSFQGHREWLVSLSNRDTYIN